MLTDTWCTAPRRVAVAAAWVALAGVPQEADALPGSGATTRAPATLSVDAAGAGSGTVISNPAGIICYPTAGVRQGTCWGSFEAGTVVTLAATPAGGSRFEGWGGACSGTGPCTVTIAQATRVTATFAATAGPTLTLSVDGGGTGNGTVTSHVPGITCFLTAGVRSGTCWSAYPAGTGVILHATPQPGYQFAGWTGACSGIDDTCPVVLTQNTRVAANFVPAAGQARIVVTGSGTGRVYFDGVPGLDCHITNGVASGDCEESALTGGYTFQLGASPPSGIEAEILWSGCTRVVVRACQVLLPSSGTVNVHVQFRPHVRAVVRWGPGDGTGTITTSPAGITCYYRPFGLGGTCGANFPTNTVLTFTATPDAYSRFVEWTEGCTGTTPTCQLLTPQTSFPEVIVKARFELLAANGFVGISSGTGFGRVVSTPVGVDCTVSGGTVTGNCGAMFAAGTTVTLTATPTDFSQFEGFGPGCVRTGPTTCRIVVAGGSRTTTYATFTQRSVVVTVAGAGSGSGVVGSTPAGILCYVTAGALGGTCWKNQTALASLTLTAVPASGSRFVGWSGGCTGSDPTCQLAPAQATNVVATFAPATAATHMLSVGRAGAGSGTVTSSPAGITCHVTNGQLGGTCWGSYAAGTSVTLTAVPIAGSRFLGWTGACSGTGACQVTMNQAATAIASFVPATASLTALPALPALPAADAAAADLLGARALSAAERALLDSVGNADGVYDLGDLLALLDRTGQRLDPATLRRLRGRR